MQTPNALAQRLGLPGEVIHAALAKLERMGLVQQERGKWKLGRQSLHLADDSPLNELNQTHWRGRAILDVQRRTRESMHYSAVFSVGRADAEKIRALLFEAIVKGRKMIADSPEEELYCLNADFFVV